jgi:spermidine synthase
MPNPQLAGDKFIQQRAVGAELRRNVADLFDETTLMLPGLHLGIPPDRLTASMLTSSETAHQVQGTTSNETLPYYVLFFFSGFPALLYQIVWQRALFAIYGVNIESVTVIVTAFMLGLGLGSLAGGRLSSLKRLPLLATFGTIELGIGTFGFFSLGLFHQVARFTSGASTTQTGLVTMCLLVLPTLLMGATLPLLVAYFVRITKNVGESVGTLYCVNTFGSATACFAAAFFVMRYLGESGSVRLAAALNAVVGMSALLLHRLPAQRQRKDDVAENAANSPAAPMLPFAVAILLSAVAGFISLAYEIVWYRLYSFVSGGRAACFALLLGFYLAGIACGSLAVGDYCRDKLRKVPALALPALGALIVWAGVASFMVAPALANAATHVPYIFTFPLVFIGASLLGSAFPLVSHAAISPTGQAGRKVSYMYIANIAGSASGSFVVGFILMDHWPIRTICLALLAVATLAAAGLLLLQPSHAKRYTITGIAAALLVALGSGQLFSNLYEKMLYKRTIAPDMAFRHVIETRSGIVTVSQDGVVFGGGVYDGRFNTDLLHDANGLFRPFALSSFHPNPSEVLTIGLASGSWAQVLANNPDVRHLTIVEINRGYLELIPQYPIVASLLHNPKVDLAIDDGRRWLVRNPGRRFDVVVMNTTYHWRAHSSNLLSVEFMNLVRSHLKPGGILYYNTTGSPEALLTGVTAFPYSLAVWNTLAVSDHPIRIDRLRWEANLAAYKIDGKPVFDLANPAQRTSLKAITSIVDTLGSYHPDILFTMEWGDSIRKRLRGQRLITDDNMGTEWQ